MNNQSGIIPVPQNLLVPEGKPILLGRPGEALCHVDTGGLPGDCLSGQAAELLRDRLKGLLNAEPAGSLPIRLLLGEAPGGVKNPQQGYRLEVDADSVTVTGFGPAGLYYGVISLIECLRFECGALTLPPMRILDWPEFATRGHFMECRFGTNLMTLDDWKRLVDHMAFLKMNQLVVGVYGCWCVQYDGRVSEYLYVPLKTCPDLATPAVIRYFSPGAGRWIDEERLPPMFADDFLGELIAYGKSRGVTVFPLFNSFGHNTLIPAAYPEVSARDENGEAALTGFCTRNPKTYALLFSIYDEIIDRYLAPNGVDSIHIGLDEVWDDIALNAADIYRTRSPWCRCEKCRGADRTALFIDHAIKIIRYLKDRGMRNIYMYHDMLIGHGGSTAGEGCGPMAEALRENDLVDSVVVDWWTYGAHPGKLMFSTTCPELGLRRTVKPWNGYYHWTALTNAVPNIRLLSAMGAAEGAEGIQSYSSWDPSYDRTHAALADCAWNPGGAGSAADMTDRYVARHFAARAGEARRAFALLDRLSEDRDEKDAKGTPVSSNYTLTLRTLSYYFYSYVRAGKPYPRVFPGEAVAALWERPGESRRALESLLSIAQEARELFMKVAADARCDGRMARRYAYEAGNYQCLAKDYIALLHMADIAESDDPGRFDAIRGLAGERKRARLSLMDELERTKEHFLLASHMRNHSIFMQFFADLEGYLAATPASDIRLDFSDMRYLESEAFRKLR